MSLRNISRLRLPFEYTVTFDAIVVPLSILVCLFWYSVNIYWEYSKKSNKIVLSKNSSNNHEQYSSKVEDNDHNQRRSICICREDMEIVLKRLGFTAAADENLNTDLSCWFEEEEVDNCYYTYKMDEVKAAFNVFDENKDGFIDAYELQRVLCVLGFNEGLDLESCKKMIMVAKVHINGDHGKLDFNEFLSFLDKGLC